MHLPAAARREAAHREPSAVEQPAPPEQQLMPVQDPLGRVVRHLPRELECDLA